MASHSFRGKSARRQRRRAGFSQASTRRGITLYDQHDREWTAQVGNKTGMPTGLITPNFRAPWIPDQQYLRVNPDNTSELFIDYDAMIARRKARLDEFHKTAVDFAIDKKLPVPTKKGEYASELLRAFGAMPKPIQPVVAAKQGNVYILGEDYAEAEGVAYRIDPRLEKYVTAPAIDNLAEEFGDFGPESSFAEAKARNERNAQRDDVDEDEFDDVDDEQIEAGGSTSTEEEDLEAFEELDGGAGDGDSVEEILEQLEDEHDAEAIGGKTVAPKKADRVAKQAPRRPGTKTAHKGEGKKNGKKPQSPREKQRARQRGDRPTLASGASPVVGGGGI